MASTPSAATRLVTTGTPIAITAGQGSFGIDFSLIPFHIFSDHFESGNTDAWSSVVP